MVQPRRRDELPHELPHDTINYIHQLKVTAKDQDEIAVKVQEKFGGTLLAQSTISKFSKQSALSKVKFEYETRKRGGAGAPPKDPLLERKLMERFEEKEKASAGMGQLDILKKRASPLFFA